MAGNLALQIMKVNLSYAKGMRKFIKYKETIDIILVSEGSENLIEN